MNYTIPDYYREFQCIASECPATCCAGWQIVIDDRTLKKYRDCRSIFGNRLANSIDWKEKTFLQYHKRCAFLNEVNLCDIYTEAGPDMLCATCRKYPRHIEEFENEREVSLSLSCPVVAEMLLERQKKVRFLTAQNDRREQYEEFDDFLYSALQDCRSVMFDILQNRENPVSFRMMKVLALAHDVQNRIDARRLFEIEALLERYQRPGADDKFRKKLSVLQRADRIEEKDYRSRMECMKALLALLDHLEVLDDSWTEQLKIYSRRLYGSGEAAYAGLCASVKKEWGAKRDAWMDIESEQLMVYFLFTYFCGAVYDGDALTKVKMAVVSTLILRELEMACQAGLKALITAFDRARIAWRYSRELEHSDQNLGKIENLLRESEAAAFESLMNCIPLF